MTDDELKALKALVESCPSGPWRDPWKDDEWPEPEETFGIDEGAIRGPTSDKVIGMSWYDGPVLILLENVSAMVCAARDVLPGLIDELLEARESLRAVRSAAEVDNERL